MSATLHLMVGLPCSGKTTYAKELEARENALRLTPDEWQRTLLGRADFHGTEAEDEIHDRIEKIMWRVAQRALTLRVSVILDFGFWAREERDFFRQEAEKLGVGFRIHYMDLPLDELLRRVRARNERLDGSSFSLAPEYIKEWSAFFQPPDEEELRPVAAPVIP